MVTKWYKCGKHNIFVPPKLIPPLDDPSPVPQNRESSPIHAWGAVQTQVRPHLEFIEQANLGLLRAGEPCGSFNIKKVVEQNGAMWDQDPDITQLHSFIWTKCSHR